MKLKNLLVIVTYVFLSVTLNAQEISGHYSFVVSSNPQYNRAMGIGGEYIHKFGNTRYGICYDYSNIYKTVIYSYNDEITGDLIYDNQYSNMLCSELAVFGLKNLYENDNSRISFGPIIGVNYLRRLGTVQRFYNPKDLRYYTYFKYDDKNFQSELGFVFEAEIKEVFIKNLSFVTGIKGVVSGIEFMDFSDPRNPNTFFNMKVELGLRYSLSCKKK